MNTFLKKNFHRGRPFLSSIFIIALSLLIVVGFTSFSWAYTPQIKSIHVNVALNEDGSALITQVWDVTVASGTEYYIPQTNLGDMEFKNFTVSDETGLKYITEDSWDVDRSIQEKAGRCGINQTGNGVELCWGVGSYGDHTYTLSYTLTNLLKAYPDGYGFNSRFINDQLSSPVQNATVTIEKPGHSFTLEEVRMWAFGFEGNIHLVNGKILATAIAPLESNNHMTLLTSYDKALFQPLSVGRGTFEDLKNTAFQGSSYENTGEGGSSIQPNHFTGGTYDTEDSSPSYPIGPPRFFFPFFGFSSLVSLIMVIFLINTLNTRKKSSFSLEPGLSLPTSSQVDYSRDIPCEGNISGVLCGMNIMSSVKETDIISAYILRWIKIGAIQVQKATRPRFLGMGSVEESSLVMISENPLVTSSEKRLYQLMRKASGEDHILQEKEFRKWSKEHYEKLQDWLTKEYKAGEDYFIERKAGERKKKSAVLGLIKYNQLVLNETGVTLVEQILGFKKYLKDFTIINERESKEVQLWDDYLIMASLLGMGDKVSKEMKELYPDFAQESVYYNDNADLFNTLIMVNAISHAGHSGMQSGINAASDGGSSGGGGSSSFGGGGGFSGGGSGGGSR